MEQNEMHIGENFGKELGFTMPIECYFENKKLMVNFFLGFDFNSYENVNNQDIEDVAENVLNWVIKLGLYTSEQRQKFKDKLLRDYWINLALSPFVSILNVSECGLFYSKAMILLFVCDDLTDTIEFEKGLKLIDVCKRVLRNQDVKIIDNYMNQEDILLMSVSTQKQIGFLLKGLMELGEEIKNMLSWKISWKERIYSIGFDNYFDSTMVEKEKLLTGNLSLVCYLRERCNVGGMHIALELARSLLLIDLSDFNTYYIHEVEYYAGLIVCLQNDAISLPKEYFTQSNQYVKAYMSSNTFRKDETLGKSFLNALQSLIEEHNSCMKEFLIYCEKLENSCKESNKAKIWIKLLKQWIVGNIRMSLHGERYHQNKLIITNLTISK
jgi:hypothetical protein